MSNDINIIEEVMNHRKEKSMKFSKNNNKDEMRDATDKSNGYFYQRRYGIYLLLNNDNIDEIIEEGQMDQKCYEDITIKYKDGKLETYQFKYHLSGPVGLSGSCDIFKTLANRSNDNASKIHYVVSKKKNGDSNYTKVMREWKDLNITPEEIYEKIYELIPTNLQKDLIRTQNFFSEKGKMDSIIYLKKYIIEDGFTYDELSNETNKLIRTELKIDDELEILFFRLLLYEKFTDNSFRGNEPMKKEDLLNYIKQKNGNDKKINRDNKIQILKHIFYNIINEKNNDTYCSDLKEITKKYCSSDDVDLLYILLLCNGINIIYKKITSDEYKKELEENYKLIRLKVCHCILEKIRYTKEKYDYEKIARSIHYYYKHNINVEINLERSGVISLLIQSERQDIHNFKKQIQKEIYYIPKKKQIEEIPKKINRDK